MLQAGKYTVREFFVNRSLRQVIVPELQRDYVWQEAQVQGLLHSLLDGFYSFAAFKPVVQVDDAELTESFNTYRKRLTCSANIGFIYAYCDPELVGRYFLIDGQQRLTTVLLLLLALAHRNSELREQFQSAYLLDGQPKLDYKVREAARDFWYRLTTYLLATAEERIDEQWWHYTSAQADATSHNLLANFQTLQRLLSDPVVRKSLAERNVTEAAFYAYLENYTDFYYFDTSLSEQGEDLYLYLNARGEQVQPNENVKAALLSRLSNSQEKNEYGRKWEDWQDFFWQNRTRGRSANENADAGFNEFLSCVAGLTQLVSGRSDYFRSPQQYAADGGIPTSQLLAALDLATIEEYVESLRFLEQRKDGFTQRYISCGWVDGCLNELWRLFNGERTNWYADYKHPDRGTERNRMVFVWPVLHYLRLRRARGLISVEAFRVLRRQYLRFTNYDRSVDGLWQETEDLCNLGPFKVFGTREENLKHALYEAVAPDVVCRYEEVIWAIEDHDFNLRGRDVGGTNISHLIELAERPSLVELQRVRDKFYALFPPMQVRYLTLQSVLLYYGPYQDRETPLYYYNFNFGNWRKTIRGLGSEEWGRPARAFRGFFAEFLAFEGSLEEFWLAKQAGAISQAEAGETYQQVLWYGQQLGNQLWAAGNYVAFSNGGYCGLPRWSEEDTMFPGCRVLYNTKGDLRGGNPRALQELLASAAVTVDTAPATLNLPR